MVVAVVGSKQATWEWLAGGFQIWAVPGRRIPKVGYIYLSSLLRQAVMAQLARALLVVYVVWGSILGQCIFFIYFNIVRTLYIYY